MFKHIYQLISYLNQLRGSSSALILFSVGSLTVLYGFPDNFKLFVLFNFLLVVLFFILYEDFFLAVYSVFFLNLFFLEPGKYYSFNVIAPEIIMAEPFWSEGLNMGYGLVSSDIFAVLLTCYFLAKLLNSWLFSKKDLVFEEILSFKWTKVILLIWAVFLLFGLYSSMNYSFNPVFSVVSFLQYCKIIIVFLSTSYFILLTSKKRKSIFPILLFSVCIFTCVVAFSQLKDVLSYSATGNNIVAGFIDKEVNFIGRLSGIFLHPNQLAFFTILFALILYKCRPAYFKNNFVKAIILLLLLLTQSRTVWTIVALIAITWWWSFKRDFFFVGKKHIIKFAAVASLILPVILWRLISIKSGFNGGSASIRIKMISQGIVLLRESPLWGFGADTNVEAVFHFFSDSYVLDFPYPVHLGFLQLALEFGLFSMIIFFLPLLILLKLVDEQRTIRALKRQNFINMALIFTIFIYYVFQPHGGRFELPLLGIVIASIFIDVLMNKRQRQL